MKNNKISIKGLVVAIIIFVIAIIAVKDIAHKQDQNLRNTNLAVQNLYEAYIQEGMDSISASIKAQDQAQSENQGNWWVNEKTKSIFQSIISVSGILVIVFAIPVGISLVKKIKTREKSIVNSNKYDDLEKLQKLKESGAISEEEFNIEKNKILNH